MNIESEEKISVAADDKAEKPNAAQRVLEVPFIGEYIGFVIGIAPPYLMLMLVEYIALGEASGKSDFLFGVLIFIWNLLLYFGFRVRATAPIIPIPMFVFGIGICVVQIIKRLFS